VINCGKVLSSPYRTVFGISLEAFTVTYFIANFGLIFSIGFGPDWIYKISLRMQFISRFLGLAIAPYLVIVELFVVKAICLYCTTMPVSIIMDFGIISNFLFYKKDIQRYPAVALGARST
jgi:uncharacterized membrane protein